MQNLGNRMFTIMYLENGLVHRRHYDEIHFQGQETDGANQEDVGHTFQTFHALQA